MKVAILGGIRIPFARANGAYNEVSNQDMLTAAMRALVERFSLKERRLGEVAAGAVIKHSRDWNLARECTLGAGLHPETPAYDLQRACGTSLRRRPARPVHARQGRGLAGVLQDLRLVTRVARVSAAHPGRTRMRPSALSGLRTPDASRAARPSPAARRR